MNPVKKNTCNCGKPCLVEFNPHPGMYENVCSDKDCLIRTPVTATEQLIYFELELKRKCTTFRRSRGGLNMIGINYIRSKLTNVATNKSGRSHIFAEQLQYENKNQKINLIVSKDVKDAVPFNPVLMPLKPFKSFMPVGIYLNMICATNQATHLHNMRDCVKCTCFRNNNHVLFIGMHRESGTPAMFVDLGTTNEKTNYQQVATLIHTHLEKMEYSFLKGFKNRTDELMGFMDFFVENFGENVGLHNHPVYAPVMITSTTI